MIFFNFTLVTLYVVQVFGYYPMDSPQNKTENPFKDTLVKLTIHKFG